jgi:protein-S-isoprenylcysteine O-methyltransferase Ste14
MWSTATPWFDATVVLGIFAVGNILFGHFEEHRPKWRRLLKVGVVLSVTLGLSVGLGRPWALGLIGLLLLGAGWIHLVWLPRNGVNGWTGEPRERYLELIGRAPRPPDRNVARE